MVVSRARHARLQGSPHCAAALPSQAARRAPTLMSSLSHLLSLKVQLPMEKVTAMEWPTKVAGTFWPAGAGEGQ